MFIKLKKNACEPLIKCHRNNRKSIILVNIVFTNIKIILKISTTIFCQKIRKTKSDFDKFVLESKFIINRLVIQTL